ncbi:MAG: hypothetical protein OXG58_11130 [Gemmatimonadetes bacterium]|nr:hypothetical protein [Gemmatimonadota bacterium]MCY3943204.1 hypothetical protein [Gemmatimonadota bacterium]
MTTGPRRRTAERLMGLLVLLALALPSASALVGLGCPHHAAGAGHGGHAESVGHGAGSDHGGGHHEHEAPSADRAAPEEPLPAPSPPCDCVGECPVPTALGAPPAQLRQGLAATGLVAAQSAHPEAPASVRRPYTLPFANAPPLS